MLLKNSLLDKKAVEKLAVEILAVDKLAVDKLAVEKYEYLEHFCKVNKMFFKFNIEIFYTS